MYPGIILYANIFIWKNVTCGSQKILSLALTLWVLTNNPVLLSSLFWLSDTSFTWKAKSNQWEWHVRHRQGSQTSAWPLNPLLAAIHRWQCSWVTWTVCVDYMALHWAPGLLCQSFWALPQPLVLLSLVKLCGSWDRGHSKFYRIWKLNIILVHSFSSSNIFSMIREKRSFVSKVFAVCA